MTHPEEATAHQDLHWLGILVALLSTCVHALQNIWEERLFLKGAMSSVLAVGIEGATGLSMSICLLPIIHYLHIEDLSAGFYQLSLSRELRVGMFWYSISSFVNNATGVVVTKWTSGLLRSLFMSMRPPMVWAFEMALGWNRFDFYNLASMLFLGGGLAVHLLAPPLDKPGKLNRILCQEVPCDCLTGRAPPPTDHSRPSDVKMKTRPQDIFLLSPQSELTKFTSPRTDSTFVSPYQTSPHFYVTDLDDMESLVKDEENSRLSDLTE